MLIKNVDLSRVNLTELCKSGRLGAVKYCLKKGVKADLNALVWAAYKAPIYPEAITAAATEEIKEVLREYVGK